MVTDRASERRDGTACRDRCGCLMLALYGLRRAALTSDVRYQSGKAFIHVVLMMAMKKCVAGVVGHEVHFRLEIAAHANGVLDDTRRRLVADLGDFEAVPVQVNWVFVAAVVVQDQTITLTPLHGEQRVRIGP
jgi:hypothetical protein